MELFKNNLQLILLTIKLTKLWRSIENFLIGKGKTQIWMVQSLTLSFLDKMDCYMGERLNMIFGTPIGKLISI